MSIDAFFSVTDCLRVLFRFLAGSMLAVLMWISNGFYIVFEIKAMLRVVLGIV